METVEEEVEKQEAEVVTVDDIEMHLEKTRVVYTKEEGLVLDTFTIIAIGVGFLLILCMCVCAICFFINRYSKLRQAVEKADHDVDV